jgi:hypothetical protein
MRFFLLLLLYYYNKMNKNMNKREYIIINFEH